MAGRAAGGREGDGSAGESSNGCGSRAATAGRPARRERRLNLRTRHAEIEVTPSLEENRIE
jgi:hypothetical protein